MLPHHMPSDHNMNLHHHEKFNLTSQLFAETLSFCVTMPCYGGLVAYVLVSGRFKIKITDFFEKLEIQLTMQDIYIVHSRRREKKPTFTNTFLMQKCNIP
jgi:hypothetical protein